MDSDNRQSAAEPLLLKVKDAAKLLNMHVNDVYGGITNGSIPALRIGGSKKRDGRVLYGHLRIPREWVYQQVEEAIKRVREQQEQQAQ